MTTNNNITLKAFTRSIKTNIKIGYTFNAAVLKVLTETQKGLGLPENNIHLNHWIANLKEEQKYTENDAIRLIHFFYIVYLKQVIEEKKKEAV